MPPTATTPAPIVEKVKPMIKTDEEQPALELPLPPPKPKKKLPVIENIPVKLKDAQNQNMQQKKR